MKTRRLLWLIAVLVPLFSSIALAAAPVELVFEHNLTTDHPWQAGAEYMAEQISKNTNGAYVVKIYPNGVLSGRDWNVMLDHTAQNISQFMVEGTIPFSTLVPELFTFQLPFLFNGVEHYTRFVSALPPVTEEWFADLEQKGLKVVAIWPRPFRQLSNSKKAIRTPEDLKGMKYRVPGMDLIIKTFRAMGAQPVPMPVSELYTALQLGTVVGEDNSVVGVFDNKTFEVARYEMLWDYMADGSLIVMNKATWDAMPANVQATVKSAAQEAAQKVIEADRLNLERAMAEMKSRGVTFITLTDAERAAFRPLVQPVYDEMSSLVGEKQLQEFIKAVEAAR
jgi:tripartite ATP-independent transporter DctP family solute receptor